MNADKRLLSYRACARSHDSKSFTLPSSSLILYFVWKLRGFVRVCATSIYSGLILFMSLKAQRAVKELHLEKMTSQKSSSKPTAKPKSNSKLDCVYRSSDWASLPYSSFIKSSFSRCPFSDFGNLLMQFDKVFLS